MCITFYGLGYSAVVLWVDGPLLRRDVGQGVVVKRARVCA